MEQDQTMQRQKTWVGLDRAKIESLEVIERALGDDDRSTVRTNGSIEVLSDLNAQAARFCGGGSLFRVYKGPPLVWCHDVSWHFARPGSEQFRNGFKWRRASFFISRVGGSPQERARRHGVSWLQGSLKPPFRREHCPGHAILLMI